MKKDLVIYSFLVIFILVLSLVGIGLYARANYTAAKEIDSKISSTEENLDPVQNIVQNEVVVAPVIEAIKPVGVTSPYYIRVNTQMNAVTIYEKRENGSYFPIKAMVCSTGTNTPQNTNHKITTFRQPWLGLFGNVFGQYATQVVGDILFHSVPYLRKYDAGSLEYWEYDKLGTTASMGCIRLAVIDAKWIYDNCKAGTVVTFYEDADPGPLGKPNRSLISWNEQNRDWDPTDPASENPW